MSDNAVQELDDLGSGYPPNAPALSSLTGTFDDLLGALFDSSEFVDVFVDTGDGVVLAEISFVSDPLPLALPGLGTFSISIGQTDEFELELAIILSPAGAKCLIFDTPVYVTCLDSNLLTPVVKVNDVWIPDRDGNGDIEKFGLAFSGLSLTIDSDGAFDATTDLEIDLPPTRIGNSGIVVEMKSVGVCLSDNAVLPAGVPAGSRGFSIGSVDVYLPDSLKGTFAPSEIIGDNLFLGTGGFTGRLSAAWPNGKPIQFGGFACSLESLLFEFKQNSLVASKLACKLTLPFFDQPVDAEIGIDGAGDFTVALADTATGLVTVSIPGVLDIELDSIGFEVKDGEMTAKLSGKLTPTFGDFNWPSFDVKELAIDSKGHVKLDGGWMKLPKQYSLDFHGFKVEITQFGMGRNDDGTKWIGMSGGVELVKGLPAGASVKGLRITAGENWGNAKISFEGVGLEFAVPGVLKFKGEVDYKQYIDGAEEIHRFDGDITLKLEAIDLEIDGTLVCGSTPSYNYFALYVDVELPEGIPLGSLPIAFYGFAGLLALQMGPDKQPADKWYDVGGNGWYQRNPAGVEKLQKWKNIKGNRAFAVGTTMGTYEDGGYIFNGRVLLALILPGPVVALTGAFDVFKERSKSSNPLFRTIAILDKPAGTLTFGVDAQYQYDAASGDLIEIHGGMEAFYDFNDPSAWHIYLGMDEPRENRIQARVFSMFDANAYFMIDAHQLSMGAWIGYSKSWQFSKLSVALEAWMEDRAIVSFKPAHLHGEMRMHGSVELRVLRFGAGLTVDALIEADVFTPFHVLGDFSVGIRLPKPLKNLSAGVEMEWGPRKVRPPRPIAFKQAAIEHFKSSVTWPLSPDNGFLAPVHEDVPGNPGFLRDGAGEPDDAAVPANLLAVPMDCRPSVTFARNVWDSALIGALAQPLDPAWEQIGDPTTNQGQARAQYALRTLHLDKFAGGAWLNVAAAVGDAAADPTLFGSWAATSSYGGNGPAQNKLLLWSRSGFDHFRNTSADWGSRFGAAFPSYPCFPSPAQNRVCLKFDSLAPGKFYAPPLIHPDNSGVTFKVGGPANAPKGLPPNLAGVPDKAWLSVLANFSETQLQAYLVSVGFGAAPLSRCGFYLQAAHAGAESQVLCTDPQSVMTITFASPASDLQIVVAGGSQNPVLAYALTADGQAHGPIPQQGNVVTIALSNVAFVTLCNGDAVCLVEVCAMFAASQDPAADTYANMVAHNSNAASLWSGSGNVLEPFTPYRLRIATSVTIAGYAYDNSYNTEYLQNQNAYFRTGGPPGIGTVSLPSGADATNFDAGLDDLGRYVEQTMPPTVPAEGQPPLSPRPVYRGFDVAARFNENYVSLMYKMAGRDLALMLYDRNNLPLRDAAGRIAITQNAWSREPSPALTASDTQWAAMINASDCATVPIGAMQANEVLTAGAEDVLLAPDALYDARLVPSLLFEDFQKFPLGDSAVGPGGHLGRWQIADDPGTAGGPSHWIVETAANSPAQRLAQTSAIGPASTSDPVPRGTMLALGDFPGLGSSDPSQPQKWTDFRLGLYLRSSSGAAVGAAFRRNASNEMYLFTMDRNASLRQLVRIGPGGATVLAQDSAAYAPATDYHLAIEALGASLRVYIDDALVFDVVDGGIAGGGIALFSSGGGGAAFSEIQAHDLSVNARPVYTFNFTTSPYVNYFHHLHSFEDGCWTLASTATAAEHAMAAAQAVTGPGVALGDAETRAFETAAAGALGQAARQAAAKVEISKVVRNGAVAALLVRSPQPLGFARMGFAPRMAAAAMPTAISPTIAKLTGATLRAQTPAQEAVTLLLLEPADLSGCRIEKRVVPPATVLALEDASSQWLPVFTFPAMGPLPDGYRVTVHSGAPGSSAPAMLRNVDLFRAAPGDPGTRVLDDAAIDLRLVAPAGDVIHARRFLEDAAYQDFPGCTVLRKADETAFIVLPPGGAAGDFAQASYRIEMSYRLDNSAVAAGSPVQSQAGNSAAETAVLDFAWTAFGE